MATNVKAVPDGFHTVTPSLTVRDAKTALEFYKKALGADVIKTQADPSGQKILHAELKVGDSIIFINDEFPEMGCFSPLSLNGTTCYLHIYVENADELFKRAVSAGAEIRMPMQDMFWGDRFGKLADPYGHEWGIGQHLEDLTGEEITKRQKEFMNKMSAASR